MQELMRFYSNSFKSDFSVAYIDGREITIIIGLDEDYSSRIHSDMKSPTSLLIDELIDLEVDEIIFIDEQLKQAIFEELEEQDNEPTLKWFNELIQEVKQ